VVVVVGATERAQADMGEEVSAPARAVTAIRAVRPSGLERVDTVREAGATGVIVRKEGRVMEATVQEGVRVKGVTVREEGRARDTVREAGRGKVVTVVVTGEAQAASSGHTLLGHRLLQMQ